MTRRRPAAALAASSIAFAVMALLARLGGRRGLGPAEMVFVRMTVGAAGCLALFWAGRARLAARRLGLLALRGLLGTLAILLFFFALSRLPAGEATLLNYTSPVFTTIFALLFLGERPGARPLLGLVVTLAGLGLTVRAGSGPILSLGVLAGFASAVVSGGAVATVRVLRKSEGTVVIFFVFAVIAALLSAPLGLIGARAPSGADTLLLLAIGLTSLVAQLLFTDALGYLGAVTAAVIAPLTPVAAYVLGAVFLGEPLTPPIAGGMAVALAGVALASLGAEPLPAPVVAD